MYRSPRLVQLFTDLLADGTNHHVLTFQHLKDITHFGHRACPNDLAFLVHFYQPANLVRGVA